MISFCFYCGVVGLAEKSCNKRRRDTAEGNLCEGQYGEWLKAEPSRYKSKKENEATNQSKGRDKMENSAARKLLNVINRDKETGKEEGALLDHEDVQIGIDMQQAGEESNGPSHLSEREKNAKEMEMQKVSFSDKCKQVIMVGSQIGKWEAGCSKQAKETKKAVQPKSEMQQQNQELEDMLELINIPIALQDLGSTAGEDYIVNSKSNLEQKMGITCKGERRWKMSGREATKSGGNDTEMQESQGEHSKKRPFRLRDEEEEEGSQEDNYKRQKEMRTVSSNNEQKVEDASLKWPQLDR